MRKMIKQPIGPYSAHDHDAEPGDRVYQRVPGTMDTAWIIDLRESTGRNKKAAGELTPRRHRRLALEISGVWYWA